MKQTSQHGWLSWTQGFHGKLHGDPGAGATHGALSNAIPLTLACSIPTEIAGGSAHPKVSAAAKRKAQAGLIKKGCTLMDSSAFQKHRGCEICHQMESGSLELYAACRLQTVSVTGLLAAASAVKPSKPKVKGPQLNDYFINRINPT